MNERIKQARKYKNMSQEELAAQIGLTRTYINLVESNKKTPSTRTIKDIARVLKINELWILTGEGEMNNTADAHQTAQFIIQLPASNEELFKIELINRILRMSKEQIAQCNDFTKKLCE